MARSSCGNCGKAFDGSYTLTKVLKILDYRNGEYGKNVPEEISISSALSLVYSQFKYDCAEGSEEHPEAFCTLCAHTLTIIYNAFKEFLHLRQAPQYTTLSSSAPRKRGSSSVRHFAVASSSFSTNASASNDIKYEPARARFSRSLSQSQFIKIKADEEEDDSLQMTMPGRSIYENDEVDISYKYQPGEPYDNENENDDSAVNVQVDADPTSMNVDDDQYGYGMTYQDQEEEDGQEYQDEKESYSLANFYGNDADGQGEQTEEGQNQEQRENEEYGYPQILITPNDKLCDADDHSEEALQNSLVYKKPFQHRFFKNSKPPVSTPASRPPSIKMNRNVAGYLKRPGRISVNGNVAKASTVNNPTRTKSKKYSCPSCHPPRIFVGLSSFSKHMQESHGEALSQKQGLETDTSAVQPHQLFKCDQCEKAFIHNRSLTLHKAVHVDPDKLTCQMCNKLFGRHSDLKRHINNVHLRLPRLSRQVDFNISM